MPRSLTFSADERGVVIFPVYRDLSLERSLFPVLALNPCRSLFRRVYV